MNGEQPLASSLAFCLVLPWPLPLLLLLVVHGVMAENLLACQLAPGVAARDMGHIDRYCYKWGDFGLGFIEQLAGDNSALSFVETGE